MQKKIFGIKGFDENLKCLGFQYEVGKEYYSPKKPQLCAAQGFHYCQNINETFKWYNNKNGNRFCIVEITGDIDYGFDKCCTNRIKIIRELKWNELDVDNVKITPETLYQLNQKGFVIGGSVALKLYGYNITRKSKEIDLILESYKFKNNPEIVDDSFVGYKSIDRKSGMDSVDCKIGLFNEKYDIILQDSEIRYTIKNVGGYDLKLQDENQIWKAKLDYALKGSMKHANDIRQFNIQFQKINKLQKGINLNDDLPF